MVTGPTMDATARLSPISRVCGPLSASASGRNGGGLAGHVTSGPSARLLCRLSSHGATPVSVTQAGRGTASPTRAGPTPTATLSTGVSPVFRHVALTRPPGRTGAGGRTSLTCALTTTTAVVATTGVTGNGTSARLVGRSTTTKVTRPSRGTTVGASGTVGAAT